MTEKHATERHDVLIVGGGLVGASLAIALDGTGLQVGLVEATPAGVMPAVFDQRNLSFAGATVNALTALGVMQKLRAPTGPIRRIHVSRQGDFGRTRLEAGRLRARSLRPGGGGARLRRSAGGAAGGTGGDSRATARRDSSAWAKSDDGSRSIRIADESGEREISARLVVAADGTRSGVREALGIAASEHDYQQTLFVARMRAEQAPDGTAYERFGEHGPTALLPRGDRHFGVVHGVAREDADEVAALDEAAWLARIQQRFRLARRPLPRQRRTQRLSHRQGGRRTHDRRARGAAGQCRADHPPDRRAGLQPRPARCADPGRADRAGARIPAADALLQAYSQRRQEDRQRTLEFSDGLARVTGNASPLLRPLRSLGLLAVDNSAALQSMLVGGAMGFRGDVPELCREPLR